MGYAGVVNGALISQRSAFLTRVYGLFAASVAMAALGVVTAEHWSFHASNLLYLGWIFMFFMMRACSRMPIVNVGFLFAFTFIGGMTLGPLIGAYHAHGMMAIVWHSLDITIGSFLALTLYVYIAKENFTWLGAFLWPALLGMLVVGILDIFWPMSFAAGTIYAYLGVLVFIGFILYDTSRILAQFPDEDYVSGAIELYLDFVNLFLFILRILSGRSRD